MKIAMFGAKGMPYPGGIENFCEELGARLAQRGHEVYVYVRAHYTKPEPNTAYRGIRRVWTTGTHSKHLDALSHTFTATLDATLKKVDICYYHSIGLSIFSPFPRMMGIKTIVHSHGLDWERAKWGRLARLFLRFSNYSALYFPNCTAIVSRSTEQLYTKKFGKNNVHYIPTGVTHYDHVEPREIVKFGLKKNDYILFLSRLVAEKGCHYLIRAYQELKTDKRLVIAGDSHHPDEYSESLKKHQSDRIVFTGFVTGRLIEELLTNAYIFAQPSNTEGLPHSVLQALSSGKCVLASDIPGNTEALGPVGFTFKCGDWRDLKDKLQYLLDNPNIVAEQEAKSRAWVRKNFDWDRITDKLEHLCLQLLNKN